MLPPSTLARKMLLIKENNKENWLLIVSHIGPHLSILRVQLWVQESWYEKMRVWFLKTAYMANQSGRLAKSTQDLWKDDTLFTTMLRLDRWSLFLYHFRMMEVSGLLTFRAAEFCKILCSWIFFEALPHYQSVSELWRQIFWPNNLGFHPHMTD